MSTVYTVRWSANGIKTHGSDDCEKTSCGIKIDDKYEVINNTSTGNITCKKCIKILNVKE